MISACKEAGVKLMYAEELCFTPKYVRLKGLLDEGALGKLIEVSGVWHEVVGVAPPAMTFPAGAQVWVPAELTPKHYGRNSHEWNVVGRLAEGMTPTDVVMELDPLTIRLVAPHLTEPGVEFLAAGVLVSTLRQTMVGRVRRPLLLLLGAALLVQRSAVKWAGAVVLVAPALVLGGGSFEEKDVRHALFG